MLDDELNIMLAMQDDEFQIILQNDEILERLQNQKYNFQDEHFQLLSLYSGQWKINDINITFFSLGLWCFLYSIKNAFAISGQPSKTDIDVVLYLLNKGYEGVTENLYEQAENFCTNHSISYQFAQKEILHMISICFRPLEMIPSRPATSSDSKPHFNLEWLTGMISIISRHTNCDRQFILYKMKLPQAFYYVIQHLKENDIKNQIRRRNTDQINAEIYKRTMDLGKMYYNTKYKD